jgi:hypothetical protein
VVLQLQIRQFALEEFWWNPFTVSQEKLEAVVLLPSVISVVFVIMQLLLIFLVIAYLSNSNP